MRCEACGVGDEIARSPVHLTCQLQEHEKKKSFIAWHVICSFRLLCITSVCKQQRASCAIFFRQLQAAGTAGKDSTGGVSSSRGIFLVFLSCQVPVNERIHSSIVHPRCVSSQPSFLVFTPFYTQAGDGSEASRLHAEAINLLNQAWDLYYIVFRKINKQLPTVSPHFSRPRVAVSFTSPKQGVFDYCTFCNPRRSDRRRPILNNAGALVEIWVPALP